MSQSEIAIDNMFCQASVEFTFFHQNVSFIACQRCLKIYTFLGDTIIDPIDIHAHYIDYMFFYSLNYFHFQYIIP